MTYLRAPKELGEILPDLMISSNYKFLLIFFSKIFTEKKLSRFEFFGLRIEMRNQDSILHSKRFSWEMEKVAADANKVKKLPAVPKRTYSAALSREHLIFGNKNPE